MERTLGEFELVVLLAVQRLGASAYGMDIRRELRERAGRRVSVPTVYSALARLERKGLVSAALGEITATRGGRAKKFFAVTDEGARAVERSLLAIERLTAGLPRSSS